MKYRMDGRPYKVEFALADYSLEALFGPGGDKTIVARTGTRT